MPKFLGSIVVGSGSTSTLDGGTGYAFPVERTFILGASANITTGVNKTNQITITRAGNITKAFMNAKAGPTGAALIVDINKNGTSIWNATQANRLQIAAAATTGTQTSFDTTALAEGDVLSIDVDQIGSTIPGSGATVQLLMLSRNN